MLRSAHNECERGRPVPANGGYRLGIRVRRACDRVGRVPRIPHARVIGWITPTRHRHSPFVTMSVTNGVVGHVVRQAVSYVRRRFPSERVSPASHRARYGVPDDVTEFSVVRPEPTVSECPGCQACSPDNRR